jgi:hypothetical protein
VESLAALAASTVLLIVRLLQPCTALKTRLFTTENIASIQPIEYVYQQEQFVNETFAAAVENLAMKLARHPSGNISVHFALCGRIF